MTYDQDPARWSTDPDQAPELLRGAFTAGRNEAPSRGQMRSLAVKLAAASAGGAVAVGTVKAASAGNTIATAASWSAAKIAGVIALAGSVVTGAVVWHNAGSDGSARERAQAPIQAAERSATESAAEEPAIAAPSGVAREGTPSGVAREGTPSGAARESAPSGATAPTTQPSVESLSPEQAVTAAAARGTSVAGSGSSAATAAPTSKSAKAEARRKAPAKSSERTTQGSTAADSSRTVRGTASSGESIAPPSEVSLLRSAQVALQSRPREAFQLTQQHRKLYPAGEFAQERDALAIQALMRAGETEQARELAQAFIRSYPSSPHAHRFREAMGIR